VRIFVLYSTVLSSAAAGGDGVFGFGCSTTFCSGLTCEGAGFIADGSGIFRGNGVENSIGLLSSGFLVGDSVLLASTVGEDLVGTGAGITGGAGFGVDTGVGVGTEVGGVTDEEAGEVFSSLSFSEGDIGSEKEVDIPFLFSSSWSLSCGAGNGGLEGY